MKMSLAVMMALTSATIAFAAPHTLTGAELDAVSAGQDGGYAVEYAGVAMADTGGLAVQGDFNTLSVADASANAIATEGDGNFVVKDANYVEMPADGIAAVGLGNEVKAISQQDVGYAIVLGDNAVVDAVKNEVEGPITDGSVGIAGDGNDVHVVNESIELDGEITEGGYGVIAGAAEITDSFNSEFVGVVVNAEITNSFNVETNTLSISGQNGVQAIANANTLGLQNVGVLLNVTTATVTGPATSVAVDLSDLGAISQTRIDQAVVNSTVVDFD